MSIPDRSVTYTPMIEQYLDIKKDYTDTIVFFRLGDFYEMFFEDAIVVSKELELVLTGKDAGVKDRVPMCGIPHHAADIYINKLVEKGFKVAICEQVEDPRLAKGIVKREIIKIITPGTIVNENAIDEKTNNYIVALAEFKNIYVICYSDVSTGEVSITEIAKDNEILFNEIENIKAKEIVVDKNFKVKGLEHFLDEYSITLSFVDSHTIPVTLKHLVDDIYNDNYLYAFGLLVNYLTMTQKRELIHLQKAQVFESTSYLKIDNHSARNLELIETLRNSQIKGSLLWLLDRCETAMGSRFLKRNILRPLIDENEILYRQNMVEIFNEHYLKRDEIRDNLKAIYDLERILGRCSFGNAHAKDLVNLKNTLSVIPNIKNIIAEINDENTNHLLDDMPTLSNIKNLIEEAIVDNPPLTIKEGGIIKDGYSQILDEIRYASSHSSKLLEEFEEEERNKTGIKKLRTGYNRVFGYYIEVPKGNIQDIKEEFGYERRQTLANVERYTAPRLKEIENLILGSNEKLVQLEYDLFIEIRDKIKEEVINLQKLSRTISLLDMIISFSLISMEYGYVKPVISKDNEIVIVDGRHPVVEKLLPENTFVKNDIILDKNTNILLITGPNMGGKTTYMRQLALIILMAQIGSFVPAKSARMPIVDQIFTRIGASDDVLSGSSTFMVELLEVNKALKNATDKSLILFDEIGRGTATYDGMSLAQSIIEYVHQKLKAKMLFSTHYHELTFLSEHLKHLKNIHVSAELKNGNIVFMHKVKDGPTDKSYGIHVAKLAKLPKSIIDRSNEVLDSLEKDKISLNKEYNLFSFEREEEIPQEDYTEVIDELRNLNTDEMSPLEALLKLNEIKDKIK